MAVLTEVLTELLTELLNLRLEALNEAPELEALFGAGVSAPYSRLLNAVYINPAGTIRSALPDALRALRDRVTGGAVR